MKSWYILCKIKLLVTIEYSYLRQSHKLKMPDAVPISSKYIRSVLSNFTWKGLELRCSKPSLASKHCHFPHRFFHIFLTLTYIKLRYGNFNATTVFYVLDYPYWHAVRSIVHLVWWISWLCHMVRFSTWCEICNFMPRFLRDDLKYGFNILIPSINIVYE